MNAKDPYQILSHTYDLALAPVIEKINRDIISMAPPVKNEAVLDIGCGTGYHLAAYQQAGCRVSGVDLSPSMLAKAHQRLGKDADLRCESAAALPFSDGSFNLVNMTLVIHEMPPQIRLPVLTECKRVCRVDGHLLLADYHTGPFPFPMGWIYRGFSLAMEVIAGRQHLANYRHFMAHQGLFPLINAQMLTITSRHITPDGVMAFYFCNM